MSDTSTSVTVHAIDSGRRDGPVVVLSNSLGSTHAMWDPQLAALEERFRVIRYDTRGHGESPVPDGPYTIDDLADDLLALLDRFEVQRAHLIGLSLGGMTAMHLAAREPSRVDRMAVLCTATRLPPASAWRQRAATVRSDGTAAVAESVVARWFTLPYLHRHPDDKRRYEQMVAATPAEGYAACCEAIAELDLRQALPNVKAPTLAIAGADDPATPVAKLAEIVDLIPDSELRVIDQAAHLANAEQSAQITEALMNHLEQS